MNKIIKTVDKPQTCSVVRMSMGNNALEQGRDLLKVPEATEADYRIQEQLSEQISQMKELLAAKDQEITRLQRETHKLKSVLERSELKRVPSLTSQHGTSASSSGSPCQKKCGVSGESWGTPSDSDPLKGDRDPLQSSEPARYQKDFRTRQLIKTALSENDFLQNLDSEQMRDMVDFMAPQTFYRGEFVISEGEPGAHLFVLSEGQLQVSQGNRNLGLVKPGVAFGELALLYNCKRTASVKATMECKVWALERKAFQLAMVKAGIQRIKDRVAFLKSVPLLKDLDLSILSRIADGLEVEQYPPGAYIIREGSAGDSFFIISNGTVRVTSTTPRSKNDFDEPYFDYGKPINDPLPPTEWCAPKETVLRDLGYGDFFGEQALLREERRSANVIALPPGVEVLTLDRDSFSQLIGGLNEFNALRRKHSEAFSSSRRKSSRSLAHGSIISEVSQESESIGRFGASFDCSKLTLDDLEFIATLGVGGFGRVELVKVVNEPSQVFALKCLSKVHVSATQQQDHVFAEKNIMLSCDSTFICKLFSTFKDRKYVYMLMEACLGGEVWTLLREKGYFDEDTTRFITGCVLLALEYLHERDIVYRDLKPENLMVDNNGYIKLVDFGFSKIVPKDQRTWTFCGTPEYCSPETILNRGHDRMVDYWSLGILLFELLTGLPPWGPMSEGGGGPDNSDSLAIYNSILRGIECVNFGKSVSKPAVNLIRRLCRQSPGERLGATKGTREVMSQRWFQGFDWNGLRSLKMKPSMVPNLKSAWDTSYFDKFELEVEDVDSDCSGWDADF